MQRLITAIDKATRAGVYTLEETANILQAIDQVGAVVKDHNERQEAQKKAQEEVAAKAMAESMARQEPKPSNKLEKA